MWKCSSCSAKNDDSFSFCCSCGAKRQEQLSIEPTSGLKTDGDSSGWRCKCGEFNKNDFAFCVRCGKARPNIEPTDWVCAKCGRKNSESSKFCSNCGSPKDFIKPPVSSTMVAVIAFSAVAVIFLAIILFMNGSPRPTVNPTVNPTDTPPLSTFHVEPSQTATPVQTLAPVQTKTPNTWGAWSSWSSEYVSPSSTREVQTSNDVIGYNMVHYGTQLAEYPHYRMFRDYSIKNNMYMYNARDSYGEKHLTKRISAEQMKYATVFPPDGSFITLRNKITDETYEGYQLGNSNAYNFGDDLYVWFVESPIYGTVYRYRDLIYH